MVATYVVPMSRAKATVARALNLVVLVALLTAVSLSVLESPGEISAGSWAFWVVFAVAVVVIFARNLSQVRRRCYLVRRPALLGAPAGGYLVRGKQERR